MQRGAYTSPATPPHATSSYSAMGVCQAAFVRWGATAPKGRRQSVADCRKTLSASKGGLCTSGWRDGTITLGDCEVLPVRRRSLRMRVDGGRAAPGCCAGGRCHFLAGRPPAELQKRMIRSGSLISLSTST